MSKILHRDRRHDLEIVKENGASSGRLILKHHGVTFLDVSLESEEVQVLKELYNKIVDNHNTLENYFKSK
ncbi:hypothetical protein Calab_1473 [Caldithrix abyssi DSM 13497]|uniref:Uncharacterized protein n=1 Tax=Caldithrix abyssi DSM 13497 TaxID=880073 RepID=H1XPW8_CALAY|nr:hypothetical protein [Caldithrix abyssi]APF20377.1 hypothetical protein Cabys_3631 [Caldithrix abyssi DSM 13497]EHO41094.1 hypothetical protein Calab_1473 [Caldithrix abyssi DSM 13497]